MSVSRETVGRLETLRALVEKWNPAINLVGGRTLPGLQRRHIDDSAQLVPMRGEPGPLWVDLGSGGGFPGLVIAAQLADSPTTVTLVESDARKSAFLRRAAAAMNVAITVENKRIEDLDPLNASTVTARALAPLPVLLSYVSRHLAPCGVALLPKGAAWRAEVEAAAPSWHYDLKVHPSRTDADAVILEVRNLHAA